MKKVVVALASLLSVPAVGAAFGEEAPAELVPSKLIVENTGAAPIACGLLFAHWYRQDFKPIAPGGRLVLPLDLDPATQAVYLINSVNRPMAVQDLFCARTGTAWAEVTHLDYRVLALRSVSQTAHIGCADSHEGLVCKDLASSSPSVAPSEAGILQARRE